MSDPNRRRIFIIKAEERKRQLEAEFIKKLKEKAKREAKKVNKAKKSK